MGLLMRTMQVTLIDEDRPPGMCLVLQMGQLAGCLSCNLQWPSTEAEYMAITEACKEAVWLPGLMGEIGIHSNPMDFFCDKIRYLSLAKNPIDHKRIKHIQVRYHYILK